MRIEIKNRKFYLDKVEKEIAAIYQIRSNSDEEFLKKWRAAKIVKLFGITVYHRKARKETEYPSLDWYDDAFWFYPSRYRSDMLINLLNVRKALKSEKTGAIFIDSAELNSIL